MHSEIHESQIYSVLWISKINLVDVRYETLQQWLHNSPATEPVHHFELSRLFAQTCLAYINKYLQNFMSEIPCQVQHSKWFLSIKKINEKIFIDSEMNYVDDKNAQINLSFVAHCCLKSTRILTKNPSQTDRISNIQKILMNQLQFFLSIWKTGSLLSYLQNQNTKPEKID